jgi:hypothetical protein
MRFTQVLFQPTWQQNLSTSHTLAVHALQDAARGAPFSQMSWLHRSLPEPAAPPSPAPPPTPAPPLEPPAPLLPPAPLQVPQLNFSTLLTQVESHEVLQQ